MDSKLKEALDFSNLMITLDNQRRILKEQYQNDLIYFFNSGQFTVTKELISFCQSLNDLEQTETILVDDNNIPIQIEDLKTFTETIVSVYFKATNKFFTEYNKIRNSRSVEGIID